MRKRSEPRSRPAAATSSGSSPRCVGERRRVGVRVDEDERPPGIHLHRHEPELRLVEAGLALGARRGAERAVEAVRPRVVGALERLALPLALADERAAVAADVQERAERRLPCRGRRRPGRRPRRRRRTSRARRPGQRGLRTATRSGRSAPARAGARPDSEYQSKGSVRPSVIVAMRTTVSRRPRLGRGALGFDADLRDEHGPA